MDLSNPINAVIPSLDGEILTVLSRTTRPLTGRQIADLADRGSQSGVRLTLIRLEEQGVVLAESAGRSILFRANREHLLWGAVEELLRVAALTIRLLQERILSVMASAIEPSALDGTTIAFFGSVARGTSTTQSDIDLVVVFPESVPAEQSQVAVDRITAGVARWTGNQCNIYATTDTALDQMVLEVDPMIGSWSREAVTFNGPDLGELLRSLS